MKRALMFVALAGTAVAGGEPYTQLVAEVQSQLLPTGQVTWVSPCCSFSNATFLIQWQPRVELLRRLETIKRYQRGGTSAWHIYTLRRSDQLVVLDTGQLWWETSDGLHTQSRACGFTATNDPLRTLVLACREVALSSPIPTNAWRVMIGHLTGNRLIGEQLWVRSDDILRQFAEGANAAAKRNN